MASAPEAQAETGAWAPARAVNSIANVAAGALGISAGTVVGATLRGPLVRKVSQASITVVTHPIPGEKLTAKRSGSTGVVEPKACAQA